MSVRFLSRYRECNDYDVDGIRVSIHDDGHTHAFCTGEATPEQREAIRLFELDRYAEYCRWHVEFKQKHGDVRLQSFECVA
jgi:hypothetical protein